MLLHIISPMLLDTEASTRIGTGAIVGILAVVIVGIVISMQSGAALNKLKKEFQKQSPDIKMIQDLAAYYLNKQKDDEAIPVLKKGLEIEPNNIDFLFMLANTYCLHDRDEEAEPYLNKLADILIRMDINGERNQIVQSLTEREAAFVTYRLGKIFFKKNPVQGAYHSSDFVARESYALGQFS